MGEPKGLLDWLAYIGLAIVGFNALVVAVLAVADLYHQWRYRRWLRSIPAAERLDQPRHIRVKSSKGRIDWPLDLEPARNGDSITIEHEEEDGPR